MSEPFFPKVVTGRMAVQILLALMTCPYNIDFLHLEYVLEYYHFHSNLQSYVEKGGKNVKIVQCTKLYIVKIAYLWGSVILPRIENSILKSREQDILDE